MKSIGGTPDALERTVHIWHGAGGSLHIGEEPHNVLVCVVHLGSNATCKCHTFHQKGNTSSLSSELCCILEVVLPKFYRMPQAGGPDEVAQACAGHSHVIGYVLGRLSEDYP